LTLYYCEFNRFIPLIASCILAAPDAYIGYACNPDVDGYADAKIKVTIIVMTDARMYPIPCIANTDATRLPLFHGLENSDIIVELSGYPPPMPNPSVNLKQQRVPTTAFAVIPKLQDCRTADTVVIPKASN